LRESDQNPLDAVLCNPRESNRVGNARYRFFVLVAKGGRIDVATSRLEPKKLPMTVGDPKHEHKHVCSEYWLSPRASLFDTKLFSYIQSLYRVEFHKETLIRPEFYSSC